MPAKARLGKRIRGGIEENFDRQDYKMARLPEGQIGKGWMALFKWWRTMGWFGEKRRLNGIERYFDVYPDALDPVGVIHYDTPRFFKFCAARTEEIANAMRSLLSKDATFSTHHIVSKEQVEFFLRGIILDQDNDDRLVRNNYTDSKTFVQLECVLLECTWEFMRLEVWKELLPPDTFTLTGDYRLPDIEAMDRGLKEGRFSPGEAAKLGFGLELNDAMTRVAMECERFLASYLVKNPNRTWTDDWMWPPSSIEVDVVSRGNISSALGDVYQVLTSAGEDNGDDAGLLFHEPLMRLMRITNDMLHM